MKKLLAFILASLMLATLVACNVAEGGGQPSDTAETEDTQKVTDSGNKNNGGNNNNQSVNDSKENDKNQESGDQSRPSSTSEGLKLVLINNDRSYAVEDMGNCTDVDVNVPSSYNGLPVTEIGFGAFASCNTLRSVILPDSVTYIGEKAFAYSKKLERVSIPDTVTDIGESAFDGCDLLSEISIPDSVCYVGYNAFSGCEKLLKKEGSVYYVGKWAVKCDTSAETVAVKEGTVGISDRAFANCSKLVDISLPDSIKHLSYYSFYGCANLTEEEGGVYYVDKWALNCDTERSNFTLRADTVGIGPSAFANCKNIGALSIPEGVRVIGRYAFKGCTYLMELEVPSTLTYIGSNAFNNARLLRGVSYNGTAEQWASIETEVGCYDGIYSSTFFAYCSDEEIKLK